MVPKTSIQHQSSFVRSNFTGPASLEGGMGRREEGGEKEGEGKRNGEKTRRKMGTPLVWERKKKKGREKTVKRIREEMFDCNRRRYIGVKS